MNNLWDNKHEDMDIVDKVLFAPYTKHDAKLSLFELIEREGLKAEKFTVITEDGHHLDVYHVWEHGLKAGSPVAFF